MSESTKVKEPGDAAFEWALKVLDSGASSYGDRMTAAQVIATFAVVDALDAIKGDTTAIAEVVLNR